MNNDIIVGARKWTDNVIDVPVMGNDGEDYSYGYLNEGDVPQFMLYHFDTGNTTPIYYDNIPGFVNNEIFMLNNQIDENLLIS